MWTLMVGAGSKVSGGRRLVDAMSGVAAERASLHGLVDVALHLTSLNCCDDLCHFASLIITKAKVLDDGHSFAREKGLVLVPVWRP